jgi:hypothetical protein
MTEINESSKPQKHIINSFRLEMEDYIIYAYLPFYQWKAECPGNTTQKG